MTVQVACRPFGSIEAIPGAGRRFLGREPAAERSHTAPFQGRSSESAGFLSAGLRKPPPESGATARLASTVLARGEILTGGADFSAVRRLAALARTAASGLVSAQDLFVRAVVLQ